MLFVPDLGIDLGTSSVQVYVKGRGVVVNEPSCVAVYKTSGEEPNGKVFAVGAGAYELKGRTPKNMEVVYPLSAGVISNYTYCEAMLKYFLRQSIGSFLFSPQVCVCIPCRITQVQRMAIMDTVRQCGARKVRLIEEPAAAAIGCGRDIFSDSVMVIDIGAGTSDMAVISKGVTLAEDSLRTAGNAFDEDIRRYLRKTYRLWVGPRTAEEIKIQIGTVLEEKESSERSMKVRGRDLSTGLPREITVTSSDVARALSEDMKQLLRAAAGVYSRVSQEVRKRIKEEGILLSGGGGLVGGLDTLLGRELSLPVIRAEKVKECVAEGTGLFAGKAYRQKEILQKEQDIYI